MLSLLIIASSLLAGICYGEFSDCATASNIASECANEHLGYLKELDNSQFGMMQNVGQLDQPSFILPKLNVICNNTMHLKEYYMCAIGNVSTCLENANSTQVMGLPDPMSSAKGIAEMCASRSDLNQTCIMMKVQDVQKCFGEAAKSQKSMEPCAIFTGLITCADALTSCSGGQALKDYIIDLRPRACPYASSAQQYMSSVVLLLLGVVTFLVAFFQ